MIDCARKKYYFGSKYGAENPVRTIPINKTISTELFIDRTVALYVSETWIRVVTNEGDLEHSVNTVVRNPILD